MKEVLFIAFSAVLFVILSPGVFLSLPKRGSLLIKAGLHAVIFAGILFIVSTVIGNKNSAENFKEGKCSFNITKPLDCLGQLTGPLLSPLLDPFLKKLKDKLKKANKMINEELRLVYHLMDKYKAAFNDANASLVAMAACAKNPNSSGCSSDTVSNNRVNIYDVITKGNFANDVVDYAKNGSPATGVSKDTAQNDVKMVIQNNKIT